MNKLFHVLTDEGTGFVLHALDDNIGVETAYLSILSRPVCAVFVDQQVQIGAQAVVLQLLDKALQAGVPVLFLFSSDEVLATSVDAVAWQKALVRLSGVCPVLAVVEKDAGEMASALLPFSDFCIYASGSHECTGSVIQALDLPDAIENLRTLLSFLPLNCAENAPHSAQNEQKAGSKKREKTAKDALHQIADQASVYDLYTDGHGKMSFARINGRSVGVIASEQETLPNHAARFIQFCDCYSLPLIVIAEHALSLNPQQVFMLSQATIPVIGIGNMTSILSMIDAHAELDAETLPFDIRQALEYLNVKRDILPPHKHGNMPL